MVSALLMLASLAMFAFPKRLRSSRPTPRALQRGKKNPSLRDFPKAVKRLLKNDILMFRTASSVLHILPIAGLYTFLPKYLESQFRLAAHTANMISGVGGILVMGLGIIISGVFILRVKPNARFVAAWIAFTAVVYAIVQNTNLKLRGVSPKASYLTEQLPPSLAMVLPLFVDRGCHVLYKRADSDDVTIGYRTLSPYTCNHSPKPSYLCVVSLKIPLLCLYVSEQC
uniref:Uncharacterized protein n=1 Tax=Timema tahoe TaxID=61484 RepID=A0A7R9P0G9_9NEOP|nr:unnamed protein product [Timema tahoe]